MTAELSRTAGTPTGKGIAYRAAHLAVPVVVTFIVIWVVGAGDVWSRLSAAEPAWVLAAVLACSAQIFLCAIRWQITARRLAARISVWGAVAEYYVSSVINTTLPGGVMGDAFRALRLRGAAGMERAAQSVVIERLAGQVALGGTLILGLVSSGQPRLQWIGAVAGGALLALGGLVWLGRRWRGLSRGLPPVAVRFASAIKDSWFDSRTALVQIALSLLVVAANLVAFVCAARAAGAVVPFPDVFYAVPLILAAMLIPFSVAGWGYREGAAAAVFPTIGATAADGVAASVIFGCVVLVASLPGLAVLLLRTDDTNRPLDNRREPAN